MHRYTGSETIGTLVAEFPGASNVLKRHRIDFCCGGDRVLSDVLAAQRIEPEAFLAELNKAAEAQERRLDAKDWRETESGELIQHIINTHHAYLTKELPVLSEFTTKILRVHGTAHRELALLHRRFHEMKTELEQHLISEEQTVFPMLLWAERIGTQEAAQRARREIGGAEHEHSAVGEILRELRELTQDYTLPAEACRTYTLTFQKLEELEADLFQHIHLENNILFPRLESQEKGGRRN